MIALILLFAPAPKIPPKPPKPLAVWTKAANHVIFGGSVRLEIENLRTSDKRQVCQIIFVDGGKSFSLGYVSWYVSKTMGIAMDLTHIIKKHLPSPKAKIKFISKAKISCGEIKIKLVDH